MIIFFGNLSGTIFWILVLIAVLTGLVYKKKISLPSLFYIEALLLISISVAYPDSAKYNFSFILLRIYTFIWPISLKNLSFLVLASLLIYFVPSSILQFEPLHGDTLFKRQSGFFTEPAYFGYWSGYFVYISRVKKNIIGQIISAILLICSLSIGAFIFTLLLCSKNIRNTLVLFLMVFVFVFFTDNYISNQFFLKMDLNGLSAVNRIANLDIASRAILNNAFLPSGFGPLLIRGEGVGVTSFLLLYLKAFGFFGVVFLWKYFKNSSRKLAVIFLVLMVGNFWETPLLFLMKKDDSSHS